MAGPRGRRSLYRDEYHEAMADWYNAVRGIREHYRVPQIYW